ncbi:hypothetical protein [Jiangella muralis]|uniref:hypothetical protein n=1 Tax=Jiangella muralis TaxID=702383 RepID=UPI0012FA2CAA|nr:hypothetical protein [Jiangella muralis]
MNPALSEVSIRLQSLGFRKRVGMVFTREVAEGVLGWLGLNRASRHLPAGAVEVNPVVGIRHQGIERLVAELRGEKFHAYQPPTVSTPLGYLMPGSHYRAWILDAVDPAGSVGGLIASIAKYGLPFMESGSTLTEICRFLDQDLGFEHQLVYRRPAAWLLAGESARSLGMLDTAESDLGDRDDAAAVELRSFIAAFRDRFEVNPPD